MEDESKEEQYGHSRKHARFPVNRVVKYTMAEGPGPEIISDIVNISQAGLQISCPRKMEPNTLLRMKVELPEKNCSILLNAKVVWSSESQDRKGFFYSGVSFPDIKGDLRSLIL